MKKKKFWKNLDRFFLLIVVILMVFGLVAVSSASAVLSFERFGHTNYYFLRQLLFVVLGFITLYFSAKIDYHVWKKWSKPIMLFSLIMLALVLVPKIGFRPSTAQSWFKMGSFLFQPSELAKLALIFYLASWFERKKGAEKNFWFGLLPPLSVTLLAFFLIILQPDLGTASIIALIFYLMLFAAGSSLQYLGALGLAAGLAFWLLIKMVPYRAARIVTFLDPTIDPRGIGYHINQALLAIGSGGFWGAGFGRGQQKHNYLPEPIGDSIFAVMAEELGFIRIVFLVILFGLLAGKGLAIAKRAPDRFGQLTAVGIVIWIGTQSLINIGALLGLLPLTGIPLPFISYGGSSLLILAAAAGVLLNISRQRV